MFPLAHAYRSRRVGRLVAAACGALVLGASAGLPLRAEGLEGQTYYPESDPLAAQAIEQWRDLKLGFMMHWGPYSQWGVVESWSLCSEDEGWCVRKDKNYTRYKADYERLKTTFNPTSFDPSKWAKAAQRAGMRYVVFTTKHHDGFCMFDTQETDYKITDEECPFHTHPKADITRAVFDAFRAEEMKIGAYFSKPDWHCPDYWWPNFATPDRNPNYSIKRYPERWERYVQFTHNQIAELTTDYGRVDILWLDGGWVRPLTDEEVTQRRNDPNTQVLRPQSQDIRMGEIVSAARRRQPGLIVVDRAVEGPYQNYLTPENQIPDGPSDVPWESCMITSSGGWSYKPDSETIDGYEAVRRLVDVVSKGGNLLLNFAPGPNGDFDPGSYRLMEELGAWMDVNGEAIYGSRLAAPHREGDLYFTRSKDAQTLYAICLPEGEQAGPPSEIVIASLANEEVKRVTLLGTDAKVQWTVDDDGLKASVPREAVSKPPCQYAWTFKIEQ